MPRNGTYYIGKTGHKWVHYEQGSKPTFYVKDEQGVYHLRTIQFYEAFGNFTAFLFSWKGSKVSALPQDTELYEDKPVVYEKSICYPKRRQPATPVSVSG